MTAGSKTHHKVVFRPSGISGDVPTEVTLREAGRRLGVGIEGVCGERATCGKCKVKIETKPCAGHEKISFVEGLSSLTEAENILLSPKELIAGYRLACQARILDHVEAFVPMESRADGWVTSKSFSPKTIDLKPAIKKCIVSLSPNIADNSIGEWEWLRSEINKHLGYNNLTIDHRALTTLQSVLRRGEWTVTAFIWMEREVIRVEPGVTAGNLGLAVDIGTTTIAGYLCDMEDGTIVAEDSLLNPQVAYGEDVISRIAYTVHNKDGLERLNQAVLSAINRVAGRTVARWRKNCKRNDILDVVIVGNTCMHHLFLNMNPEHLGRSPFSAGIRCSLNLKARDLGIRVSPGAYVHVLPIEAGFVGADTIGMLIAEEPYLQDEFVLLVDIGTNGELVLGSSRRLVSASCATGPAIEGGNIKHGMRAVPGAITTVKIDDATKNVRFKVIGMESWNTNLKRVGAKGICGSGVIDAVSEMLRTGIVDYTGRFRTSAEVPRLRSIRDELEFVIAWARETSVGHDITISQQDVRNLQLAKAALRAGASVLMDRLGVNCPDRIILAGAFGSHVDKESVARIGMLPDCDLDDVSAVGNAAGQGAVMALLNTDKRSEATKVAEQVEYVELSGNEDFDKRFVDAMHFPRDRAI